MRQQQRNFFLAITLALLIVPPITEARNQAVFAPRWYIAPQYSYAWPDSKESTHNGSAWQLEFGIAVAPQWNLEFSGIDYNPAFDNGSPGSYHQNTYGLSVLWFFNARSKPFAPFLLLGLGLNHQMLNDVGCRCYKNGAATGSYSLPNTGLKLYGTFGIGFLLSPWGWDGALRFSLQYLHTGGNSLYGNHGYNDRIAGIGLQIPLGPRG